MSWPGWRDVGRGDASRKRPSALSGRHAHIRRERDGGDDQANDAHDRAYEKAFAGEMVDLGPYTLEIARRRHLLEPRLNVGELVTKLIELGFDALAAAFQIADTAFHIPIVGRSAATANTGAAIAFLYRR